MGITRSFNKQNGVYYAYETTYEWSEEKQKKVQKKRCIGQFIPGTDEVIPNGPRGRKSKGGTPVIVQASADAAAPNYANIIQALNKIHSKLDALEQSLDTLSAATHELADEIESCLDGIKS